MPSVGSFWHGRRCKPCAWHLGRTSSDEDSKRQGIGSQGAATTEQGASTAISVLKVCRLKCLIEDELKSQ